MTGWLIVIYHRRTFTGWTASIMGCEQMHTPGGNGGRPQGQLDFEPQLWAAADKLRGHMDAYGQESNYNTWKLARMNLAIRGIDANLGPRNADSFRADLHPDLKADFVLANPPFNMSDWGGENLRQDVRWKFGMPPVNNANYAWIQHFIHRLSGELRVPAAAKLMEAKI
jgi:N-6 DNA Methylase